MTRVSRVRIIVFGFFGGGLSWGLLGFLVGVYLEVGFGTAWVFAQWGASLGAVVGIASLLIVYRKVLE